MGQSTCSIVMHRKAHAKSKHHVLIVLPHVTIFKFKGSVHLKYHQTHHLRDQEPTMPSNRYGVHLVRNKKHLLKLI